MTDEYQEVVNIKYGYDDHLELESHSGIFYLYWDDIPYLFDGAGKYKLYVKEVKE